MELIFSAGLSLSAGWATFPAAIREYGWELSRTLKKL
jgi:hypothetical protein